ncbi:chemotaxis protein CheA [Candidatus Wolfebacteria bacterium]|nr:chemotaxis protein CheA [Candidatus Wolfebacteria bacterium]
MVDLSKFKDLFVSESEDLIQKLNDNLLAFEKNSREKSFLDELMRASHTMKSSSATMGYKQTAFLTHIMEDVFDGARNGILEITPEIINEVFKIVDLLSKSIDSIKERGEELNLDEAAKSLKSLTGVATEGTGKSTRTADGKPVTKQEAPPAGDKIKSSDKNGADDSFHIEKSSHIKVPVKRLDNLIDLVEELLIDKLRLKQITHHFNLTFEDSNLTKEQLAAKRQLVSITEHLSRNISDIRYNTMEVRLVPIDQIFARFPRMVRDLAQSQKKEIQLEMSGGEMELDRVVVDRLAEPLVHILRNAIDHGIEKEGVISMKAERQKDFAFIIIENNGNSIDFEKVREVVVKKNIVSADEALTLTKKQLIDFLYHPRVSTKETVTETSGRGVGLSVVKNFVEAIGGRIILESPLENGKGARFILQLPLSIAIIDALLVGIADYVFAIPFSSIERSVNIPKKDIKSIADQDVAVVDGIDVPLARLNKLFNFDNNVEKNEETAVLIKREKDIVGIVVDKLITEQEIVIKPFPAALKKIKGFSGSTILGDGRTILILDTMTLLEDPSRLVRTIYI